MASFSIKSHKDEIHRDWKIYRINFRQIHIVCKSAWIQQKNKRGLAQYWRDLIFLISSSARNRNSYTNHISCETDWFRRTYVSHAVTRITSPQRNQTKHLIYGSQHEAKLKKKNVAKATVTLLSLKICVVGCICHILWSSQQILQDTDIVASKFY
jgi:hypothetical protein